MDYNDYKKYKSLKEEQKRLKDRINGLMDELDSIKSKSVVDSVVASDNDFPYTKYVAKIEGIADSYEKYKIHLINAEIENLHKSQKQNELMMHNIRESIDMIHDEYVRSIATYRFINGMRWKDIAIAMGGGNSEATVRIACKRFFDKQ